MNEDICKREVDVYRYDVLKKEHVGFKQCNKPKNPEHLYCKDCEEDAFKNKALVHYPNEESSSDEWRAEVDSLDSRDPLGTYHPDFVAGVPYDPLRQYKSRDWALGNGDENDK